MLTTGVPGHSRPWCSRLPPSDAHSSPVHVVVPSKHSIAAGLIAPGRALLDAANPRSSSSSRTYAGRDAAAPIRQRRRRKSSSSEQYDPNAEDNDNFFLDPLEAAKLRRLLRSKGKDAVVDSKGVVKVPVAGDTPAAVSNKRPVWQADPQQEAAAAAAGLPASPAETGLNSSSGRSMASLGISSSGHQRLFDSSQLQPAAPGTGGTAAVLPIVRPSSSSSSEGSSRGNSSWSIKGSSRRAAPGSTAFFSSQTWQELGAAAEVQQALQTLGITRPSHVQAEAYKALNQGSGNKHMALADQAGSGKTLAYLLPLLQQLKQEEVRQGGPCTQPHSPSIIVMAPTTELVQQVGRVVRALSGAGLRVRSAITTGGQTAVERRSKTFRTQCELLQGGVDVLIATPGRLIAHLERGSLKLDNTAALVMDEVDVLAGGEVSYDEHIAPLRAAAPASMRCVLVSATLPQHTLDELQELFSGLGGAFGPGLHRTATGLVEELIDCSGGEDVSLESGTQRKLEALAKALERIKSPRTVVFCNKIDTCRVVENAMKRSKGPWKVLAYHEAIREDLRGAALNTWLTPPVDTQPPLVLVCTDRTSRGIDSIWCEHVVLFEFPRDPSEYVRRVGRTARGAGGQGVVTVLVLGKQVPLAKEILDRNRQGAPVHRVPRMWRDQ